MKTGMGTRAQKAGDALGLQEKLSHLWPLRPGPSAPSVWTVPAAEVSLPPAARLPGPDAVALAANRLPAGPFRSVDSRKDTCFPGRVPTSERVCGRGVQARLLPRPHHEPPTLPSSTCALSVVKQLSFLLCVSSDGKQCFLTWSRGAF